MKKFAIYLIFPVCAIALMTQSCSKQSKASLEAAMQQADDKLADIVGKGQVALQMYRDRHAEIRTQLIAIKAMIKRSDRMVRQKEQQLASIPPEQTQKRQMVQSMIDHYKKQKEILSKREQEGIEALKKSFENYEAVKMKVELIEEQIDSAKAASSFETALDPGTTSKEVNRLIGLMEKDLDTAEAKFEVDDLDFDL